MDKQTRMIGGMRFEKIAEGYTFMLSKKHMIIITRNQGRGWIAKEQRLEGKGSYMKGMKFWETIHACTEETQEEALAGLLEMM